MRRGLIFLWVGSMISAGCSDAADTTQTDGGAQSNDASVSADGGGSAGDAGGGNGGDSAAPGDGSMTTPDLCGAGGSAVFCEGFEKDLTSDWNVYNGTFNNGCGGHSVGLGQRDTSRAHSGGSSWHANVNYIDDGSCQAELRRDVTLPMPDTFVRMFVYLPAATVPSITNNVELSMFSEGHNFGALGPTIFGGTLGVDGYGDVTPPTSKDASAFPTDRWVCVEWQLHQGSSPTYTEWRDGNQMIAPVEVKMPSLAEPLNEVFFGIYGYANLGAVDIWYDDVALSATRIGCTAQ